MVLHHPPFEVALQDHLDPLLPRELPRPVPLPVEQVVAEPAARSAARARCTARVALVDDAVVDVAGRAVAGAGCEAGEGREVVVGEGSGGWGSGAARAPGVGAREGLLACEARGHVKASRLVERAHGGVWEDDEAAPSSDEPRARSSSSSRRSSRFELLAVLSALAGCFRRARARRRLVPRAGRRRLAPRLSKMLSLSAPSLTRAANEMDGTNRVAMRARDAQGRLSGAGGEGRATAGRGRSATRSSAAASGRGCEEGTSVSAYEPVQEEEGGG